MEAKDDAIVVTGSRIARAQFEAPNPIVSYNAAAILQSGRTNVTDFLTRIPALVGSATSNTTAGSNADSGTAGLNLLDLRNLGTNRTLVLVNGRRHVAGDTGTAAVDVNTIPTDLIERVDVLTGGASAVYGADGVSGVVNFILKQNFEGISARGQAGISRYGDAGNRFGSFIAGHNFADGHGNFTLAYEYDADDRVSEFDRKRLTSGRRNVLVRNQADIPDDPNVPDYVFLRDIRYADSSPNGAIDIGGPDDAGVFTPGLFDGIPDFTGDGTPYDRGNLLSQSGGLTQGGSSTPTEGYQGDLAPRIRRHNVNAMAHYDFSDAFKLSVEGKFVQVRTKTLSQPTFDYYLPIAADNPFIPANIAALAPDGVTVTRDNFDFGIQAEKDLRRTYRGVVDVSGRISDHATYDAYYEYGRTHTVTIGTNNRLTDRFYAAFDAVTDPATGQPTCRSNLDPTALAVSATTFTPGAGSGCSPLNLFGYGSPSRASLDFLLYDTVSRATITQQVASGSVTGDFGEFFKFPGGPLKFSFGAEYRRETSRFTPDPALQTEDANFPGNSLLVDNAVILPSAGRFNVKEGFAELDAPIFEHVRFAETLSLGAAFRYSSYSTIGSTKTYQLNAVYAPIRDISFRGSYSKAVRAPNISELFAPRSGTFAFFTDPCDPTNVNNGTQYRAANCAALLSSLGIDPTTYDFADDPQSSVSVNGTQGGNPDLAAERATTITAGVVLRPRFIQGFTASIDYYNIRLRKAISIASPERLAELCVDQPSTANQYCGQVSRDPTTGFLNGFTISPQNVAAFKTAGIDLNLNYTLLTDRAGSFDFRLVGSYLDKLTFVATPGADPENDANTATNPGDSATARAPRWQANFGATWTKTGFTATYNLGWFSRTRRFSRLTTAGDPDYTAKRYLFFKNYFQHDISLGYTWDSGLNIYGGVNNFTDEKPSIGSENYPISNIGRFMYVGAKITLARIFGG